MFLEHLRSSYLSLTFHICSWSIFDLLICHLRLGFTYVWGSLTFQIFLEHLGISLRDPIKQKVMDSDIVLEVALAGTEQSFETFHRALNAKPRQLTDESVPMWRELRILTDPGRYRFGERPGPVAITPAQLYWFEIASDQVYFDTDSARRVYTMGWRAIVRGSRVTRSSTVQFIRIGVILFYSNDCAYSAPCA